MNLVGLFGLDTERRVDRRYARLFNTKQRKESNLDVIGTVRLWDSQGGGERPGGESAPLPGLSTGLPWLYFLCRAVSVWFPRRRNSINPTPKSVNAANATVGADTPVLASWRIVFTMAGVAGGM